MNSKRPIDLFVGEFITGGGLAGEPIPHALAAEGDGMLRALLRDLLEIDGVTIVTTRDACLPPLAMGVTEIPIQEHPWECWAECIGQAQAVWPIAPETGGVLERLSREVLRQGRCLIGSRPEAIAIAASKRTTAKCLAAAGVPVVETVLVGGEVPDSATGWVVKPDDGAGCENTFYFGQRRQLESWLNRLLKKASRDAAQGENRRESTVDMVVNEHFEPVFNAAMRPSGLFQQPVKAGGGASCVQPYVAGTPASLSLLCAQGMARILACNEQLIELRDGQFHLSGIKVNALSSRQTALQPLAERIAQALPGLWGYVGVDLILAESGAVVMEINPRLTTSYVSLAQAIGQNPAGLVIDLLREENTFPPPSRGRARGGVQRLNLLQGLNPYPNLPPAKGKG